MSKPLKHNYFVRRTSYVVALGVVLNCGGHKSTPDTTPQPTAPLPTAGLAGQRVPITPLALVAAEDTLHWDALIADRRVTLDKSDSIISTFVSARAPEVTWVSPGEVRRISHRAVGIAADADQMGTPFLRADKLIEVPDPLRSQLRTLAGLAGSRYVLVPAGLVFRVASPAATPRGRAVAELSIVLVDSRTGRIGWRTTARGAGDDPWTALTRAVKNLTPGLP